jgi:hypothetical protein
MLKKNRKPEEIVAKFGMHAVKDGRDGRIIHERGMSTF